MSLRCGVNDATITGRGSDSCLELGIRYAPLDVERIFPSP